MKLRCIIVDDEPLAVDVIRKYVLEFGKLDLVNTFNSAVECLSYLEENTVDLIFLDINMPLLDGLNFIKNLQRKPMIVLTTAHPEYALKGYELDVLDYLVKPVPFHRFVMSVNKAIKAVEVSSKKPETLNPEKEFIFIKVDKKKLQKIYLDDITVIESLKDYIKIITDKGKFIVHQTLSSFTDELPADKFVRIHRSYTISIDKVNIVEGNSVEIAGIRYTIGRSYLNEVKKTILNIELEDTPN